MPWWHPTGDPPFVLIIPLMGHIPKVCAHNLSFEAIGDSGDGGLCPIFKID